jgi:hypothetical protein
VSALGWIVSDDVGVSSMTIWAVMMGVPYASQHPPRDVGDFGR